ncbi:3'-5' exonuclease [Legionella drozanskii]|uniref:Excinuclease ABC subunit C n=1 Tax=Legionella drozanskii LLAP-1 TaxID=1212489 RepID=A0A0W0SY30_9GAMM|nr:3'-5' exonuclease [Legionella drozanskii]KTC88216.1 excinuclease ABC subunit C [Legionella drozanskii LLAP-1]
MYDLLQKEVLIIDCQTTGMHPTNAYLLQIGWALFNPENISVPKIEKWTLKLPAEEEIPRKIKKMLQISESDLVQSIEPQEAFNKLQKVLKKLGPKPIVVAHYAQFENSFLRQFYQEQSETKELNFKLICSQKIAKRLLPNIPSHNLKAISGYFKLDNTPKNEVVSHVSMTLNIWKQLLPKLLESHIESYEDLIVWLNKTHCKRAPVPYEYNIERFTRLNLSAKPGIYRMLAKDGAILYVGKATSLRTRVNSYFRGTKNRDRRKLEMLAQVWDIETVECETPLEAALLESDEIKKWNPPYNILLKGEDRRVLFYNSTFTEYSEFRDSFYFNGPFRSKDAISHFLEIIEAYRAQTPLTFFEESITPETFRKAWEIFCKVHHVVYEKVAEMNNRKLLALAHRLLRKFEHIHGKGVFQIWWENEKNKNLEENLNLEQKLSSKIWRFFIRAAEAKRKSYQLIKMFNSSLIINKTNKILIIRDGEINWFSSKEIRKSNQAPLDISHYDRLSILLAARNKKLVSWYNFKS